MSEKLNLARIKKFGLTFEISIDSDNAIKYKNGEITDLREVLLADNIYSDARKGQVVSDDELERAFQSKDIHQIANIILKEGEIQLTSDHRAEEREQKRYKLINMINVQAVDPSTDLPHPPRRIQLALEQAKIHLDDHKSVEDQFDEVISKLRPIIPIKIEQKQLVVTVPSTFAGKAYNLVHSNSKVLKEDWQTDGSWKVKVELPAGLVPGFIEKLNSFTHGDVVVE